MADLLVFLLPSFAPVSHWPAGPVPRCPDAATAPAFSAVGRSGALERRPWHLHCARAYPGLLSQPPGHSMCPCQTVPGTPGGHLLCAGEQGTRAVTDLPGLVLQALHGVWGGQMLRTPDRDRCLPQARSCRKVSPCSREAAHRIAAPERTAACRRAPGAHIVREGRGSRRRKKAPVSGG